jgi:hypothetical protein
VHGLGAIPGADLGEQVVDVRLDGGFADDQRGRDLAAGQPARDQRKDLGFAW